MISKPAMFWKSETLRVLRSTRKSQKSHKGRYRQNGQSRRKHNDRSADQTQHAKAQNQNTSHKKAQATINAGISQESIPIVFSQIHITSNDISKLIEILPPETAGSKEPGIDPGHPTQSQRVYT